MLTGNPLRQIYPVPGTYAAMGADYTEDECILALHIYLRTPRKYITKDNPDIVELSNFLSRMGYGRSPGSVKAKVENFKTLDPYYEGRGLSHGSKTDKKVWDIYAADGFRGIAEAAETARRRIAGGREPESGEELLDGIPGEVRRYEVGVRMNQDIFRARVMNAYGSECCLTGVESPPLLRASHIKPWSACGERAEERIDPRNGLCLNAFHDAAFDRGFFTLDEKLRVELSPYLKEMGSKDTIEKWFRPYEGKKVEPAVRICAPSEEYLEYHRREVFVDTAEKIDRIRYNRR